LRVTVSIGVADLLGHGDMETLLAECDAALYRAKASGRNCVAV
jgi:PleD family two-component response regulator